MNQNLDDLMAAWRTQDSAPLHDVNRTLLQEILRQDEAKLQKARRVERWIRCCSSAGIIATMALFSALMFYFHQHRPEKTVTVWDFTVAIAGAIAALLAGSMFYRSHQARAQREQGFGESLRDQINRRLAQLDDVVTSVRRRTISFVLMGAVCPLALLHLGMRINDKSLGDISTVSIALLVLCFWAGAQSIRQSVQRAAVRKRELEALLKELDGQ